MRMRNRELGNINASGGLLSEHFLVLMREDSITLPFAAPKTFKLPWSKADDSLDKKEYNRRVSKAWNELLERWDLYGYGKLQKMDPADARSRWTMPLLEALGFELVSIPKHIEISESMKFRFSHRGWIDSPDNGNPPVVHIVPPTQNLDERPEKSQPSPHDALQAFLNVHEDKWGLVTNGLYLRLLRDYHHTYTKGYVEFDLEAIFLTRSFSDFQALYRMAHASRFLPSDEGEIYLEEYFEHSQSVGEKIGAGLRQNVLLAITTLGNGFLDAELLSELKGDQAKCHRFYEEILKTIYRIIFLLYAEQRGMLGGSEEHNLYLEEYSLTALRERAAIYGSVDSHKDHWIGLKNTFRIIWKGSPELGIYPYNGMLFETSDEEYTTRYDCKNSELFEAIRYLTLTEIDGTARRISYSEIDVTEIGAIYEGLLDYTPRVIDQPEEIEGVSYSANSFILDPRGSARKTSGSYYTHQDLVQELIKSALEPVLAERLKNAGLDKEARERAILSIKVCDMTSGSGAFLIAACNRLALELARVRMEPTVPNDNAIQEAKRDVLQSCIYGVDLNPMAVELAKVSLWINAMVKDKPLNFLDHHIKCGNSLIGATPELIAKGVPDEAFEPVTGDDKAVAKEIKKINKSQRANKTLDAVNREASKKLMEKFSELATMEEDSAGDVVDKCRTYHKLKMDSLYRQMKLEADAWTAAFFMPLTSKQAQITTTAEVRRLGSQGSLEDSLALQVEEIAEKTRFFHWHLEFPEVFVEGGFDVILGNPPWDIRQAEEEEFFASKAPEIAQLSGNSRKDAIKSISEQNFSLYKDWMKYKHDMESEVKFLRNSGIFPYISGKVNLYAIFAQLVSLIINNNGRAGVIVPNGIATDDSNKQFFASLVNSKRLLCIIGFENESFIFQGVHHAFKFCTFTIGGKHIICEKPDYAFFCRHFFQILEPERHFSLTCEDIARINPNTHTCPIFRSRRDAELTRKIYEATPVLINEATCENIWNIGFRQGLFNMTSDSYLFKTRAYLEENGFVEFGNRFLKGNELYLPLYEAKMFYLFDHRFGTYESFKNRNKTHLTSPNKEQYTDPSFIVQPWYWVKSEEVQGTLKDWQRKWLICFRDITNATNERSAIFSIIPCTGIGNNAPLLIIRDSNAPLMACAIAAFNSLVFDWIARQKIAGTHLNFFIIKQLPFLSPYLYTAALRNFIVARVAELTYTAWDIKAFADDLWREADETLHAALKQQWDENVADTDGGHAGAEPPSWVEITPDGFPYPPFKWDEERRTKLRAELDAIYAHLYGLTGEELDYILETFPIVRRKDIERYGRYRTKEIILEYYVQYKNNGS